MKTTQMAAVPPEHPMRKAMDMFLASDEGKNALYLAQRTHYEDGREIDPFQREVHVKGALWAAFAEGWSKGWQANNNVTETCGL